MAVLNTLTYSGPCLTLSSLPPPASGPTGSRRAGYRPGGGQHWYGPGAHGLRPGPPSAGQLPCLHPGGPLRGGGAWGRALWRCGGLRGGGTSGRPGNIRLLLRTRAEGVSQPGCVCVCVTPQLLAHVRYFCTTTVCVCVFTWACANVHMVICLLCLHLLCFSGNRWACVFMSLCCTEPWWEWKLNINTEKKYILLREQMIVISGLSSAEEKRQPNVH